MTARRTGCRAALALALAAGVATCPGARADDGGAPRASPPAGEKRPQPVPDRRPPDAHSRSRRSPDPDQVIIEHLDEIEHLELLENMELFDPEAQKDER